MAEDSDSGVVPNSGRIDCKYGENAWQKAHFEPAPNAADDPLALVNFIRDPVGAPSYNDMAELDRNVQTLTHIAAGADVNLGTVPFMGIATKHGNPCGAAIGDSRGEVVQKLLTGDQIAIFGGTITVNFEIDRSLAEKLVMYPENKKRFLGSVVAPGFDEGAREYLSLASKKMALYTNPELARLNRGSLDTTQRWRFVRGGRLVQDNYSFVPKLSEGEHVSDAPFTDQQYTDLILAWAIGCTSNSNTITVVKNGELLGNAVGQQDRVGSAALVVMRAKRAGHDLNGAVAYSDSFFPFSDGVQVLIEAGIKIVFATTGSIRDREVQQACLDQGVSMLLMPDAEARGFFGH